jgi:hypothetical protein
MGVFGNSTLSDLSGFLSDDSTLISEKIPLKSLRVQLPNAPNVECFSYCVKVCVALMLQYITLFHTFYILILLFTVGSCLYKFTAY